MESGDSANPDEFHETCEAGLPDITAHAEVAVRDLEATADADIILTD